MTVQAAAKPPESGPLAKRKGVPFFRHKPIADLTLNRRSREAKRKHELLTNFATALGVDAMRDPILAQKVSTAAELAVVAELTRAAFMRGEGSADDCVRTSRAAALAEKALGIDARRKPAKPDLGEYLRGKAAA